MSILAFGEVLWDVYPEEKFLGGATLNFAAHLAKWNKNVYIATSIGADSLGNEALFEMNRFGIKTDYVSILKEKETGKCLVSLNEKGIPEYNLLCDVAYDYIETSLPVRNYQALYFGTLALREEYNTKALLKLLYEMKFDNIFVDVNIRPPHSKPHAVKLAFENASIIKISDEELDVVLDFIEINKSENLEELCKLICKKYNNLKTVIITLGEKGVIAYNSDDESFFSVDAQKTKVVSTVGAGDSFGATFLASVLDGKTTLEALKIATRVSAFVVSCRPSVPDYKIEDFILNAF